MAKDEFRVPKEPVADPSEKGGLAKPIKQSEPALPSALTEEAAELVEVKAPKISPRFAYEVTISIDRKKATYQPEGGAVDQSEAIQRVVSANPDLRPWLPGSGKAQWKVVRKGDTPINADQLTAEQLEALKEKPASGNAA